MISESEKGNVLAIWGAGNIGKKVYHKLKYEGYKIAAFYDSDPAKWNNKIDDLEVREYNCSTYFVIIATEYWKEIVPILEQSGKEFIKDFLPYWMFKDEVKFEELMKLFSTDKLEIFFNVIKKKKKIAMIYGNCQTEILKNMLLFHPGFTKDYLIITIPIIPAFKNLEHIKGIVDSPVLWKEIDLFIYQNVRLDNRFSKLLSTENLIPKLRKDCMKISIISIYFKGYFIQYYPVYNEDYLDELFPFNDKFIDDYMSKKRTKEEIEDFLDKICSNEFLSYEEVQQECKYSLQELKEREQFVDIKISDYIEEHYQKRQLFYSVNHPDIYLLYEYANRILEFMKFEELPKLVSLDMFLLFGGLKGGEMVVYPSVIHVLGMNKWEKMYFPNRMVMSNLLLDFKEYQKKYIEYRYL